MRVLTSRLTVTNSTRELRVRLNDSTLSQWESLKAKQEASAHSTYSDSAFLRWLLNELTSLQPTLRA